MPLTLDKLRQLAAGMFLVLFVVVWAWIAAKLLAFTATPLHPQLELSTAFTTVSGVVSGAVGAGTAAALGINVQQIKTNDAGNNLAAAFKAPASSPLVVAGIVAYLLVGVALILVWLAKGNASPEIVESFSVGALAWAAGSFAAVFTP